jgi:hypothetical protein
MTDPAVWLGSKRKRTRQFGGGDLETRHSREGRVLLRCTPAGHETQDHSRLWPGEGFHSTSKLLHCPAKGTEVKLSHMLCQRLAATGGEWLLFQSSSTVTLNTGFQGDSNVSWVLSPSAQGVIPSQLWIYDSKTTLHPQHKAVSRLVPYDSGHYARWLTRQFGWALSVSGPGSSGAET